VVDGGKSRKILPGADNSEHAICFLGWGVWCGGGGWRNFRPLSSSKAPRRWLSGREKKPNVKKRKNTRLFYFKLRLVNYTVKLWTVNSRSWNLLSTNLELWRKCFTLTLVIVIVKNGRFKWPLRRWCFLSSTKKLGLKWHTTRFFFFRLFSHWKLRFGFYRILTNIFQEWHLGDDELRNIFHWKLAKVE